MKFIILLLSVIVSILLSVHRTEHQRLKLLEDKRDNEAVTPVKDVRTPDDLEIDNILNSSVDNEGGEENDNFINDSPNTTSSGEDHLQEDTKQYWLPLAVATSFILALGVYSVHLNRQLTKTEDELALAYRDIGRMKRERKIMKMCFEKKRKSCESILRKMDLIKHGEVIEKAEVANLKNMMGQLKMGLVMPEADGIVGEQRQDVVGNKIKKLFNVLSIILVFVATVVVAVKQFNNIPLHKNRLDQIVIPCASIGFSSFCGACCDFYSFIYKRRPWIRAFVLFFFSSLMFGTFLLENGESKTLLQCLLLGLVFCDETASQLRNFNPAKYFGAGSLFVAILFVWTYRNAYEISIPELYFDAIFLFAPLLMFIYSLIQLRWKPRPQQNI
ncbi:hypothetical protein CRE_02953 [Caenorhabditis remanei]|uniref:Uncharacterized protein n=1 Tax=Caenorhabditis remanei TaxID=31234 RepID=E3LWW4_CAERE|nr:hypothetical protein CRE_02953 [Caenorhabditis remanei]